MQSAVPWLTGFQICNERLYNSCLVTESQSFDE